MILLLVIFMCLCPNAFADFNNGNVFGRGIVVQANGVTQTGGGKALNFASGTTVSVVNNAYQITAIGGIPGGDLIPNVGIGSANPGQTLDVNGTVRATNFIGNGSQLTGIPKFWLQGNTGIGTYSSVSVGTVNPTDVLEVQATTPGGITLNSVPSGQGGNDSNTTLLLTLNNNVTDTSQNNYTVTNSGVTFTNSNCAFAGTECGNFNGSSAFLSAPAASIPCVGTSDCTRDFWIYPTSFSLGSSPYLFMDANSNSTYTALILTLTGELALDRYVSGSSTLSINSSTGIISLNNPYFITVVKHSSVWTIYVNGISVATGSDSSPYPSYSSSFISGIVSNLGDWFQGTMSEIRNSNTARWTTNFTPPTSPYSNSFTSGALTLQSQGTNLFQIVPSSQTTSTSFLANSITSETFSSTGNVGVSSTSPNGTLDVGTGTICLNHVCNSTWPVASNYWNLASGGNIGIDTISGVGIGTTFGNAGLTVMNGNVGIGTWKPVAPLSVIGNQYISGNLGIGTTTSLNGLDVTKGIAVGLYAGQYSTIDVNSNYGLIVPGYSGFGTATPDQQVTVAGGNLDMYPEFTGFTESGGADPVGIDYQNKNFCYATTTGTTTLNCLLYSNSTPGSAISLANTNFSGAKDLAILGSNVYIISNNGTNSTLTIDNLLPSTITLASNTTITGLVDDQVFPDGRYLFIKNNNNSISSYDVSNKSAPLFLQTLSFNAGYANSNEATCRLLQQTIYCGNEGTDGSLDFSLINVSNPSSMSTIHITVISSGSDFGSGANFSDISVNDNMIYTVDSVNGLSVFNFPKPTSNVNLLANSTTGLSAPSKVIARGHYIYVIDPGNKTLNIFNYSEYSIALINSTGLAGKAYNQIASGGGITYLLNSGATSSAYGVGGQTTIYASVLTAGDTDIGNLDVSNDGIIKNNFTVSGSSNIGGSLSVNGDSVFTGTTYLAGNVGIGTNLTSTAALTVMSGNVGIGTTTPAGALTVMNGNVGIGTWVPSSLISVGGTCHTIGPVGTCWTSTGQLGYCSGAASVCSTCTAC